MKTTKDLEPKAPPGCACTVPLTEVSVAAGCGGGIDGTVANHVRELGITVLENWRGDPAVSVADAARLRVTIEAFLAEHDAAWRAYQRHVEEERQKAAQARREERERENAEAQAAAARMSEARAAAYLAQVEEDRRAAEAAEVARRGSPLSFTEFKAGKAS